jgi:hypothetical protein
MLVPLLACTLFGAPQERTERTILDLKAERERILVESGERHLEYGLELRRKGLTIQAATQITLAVEVSSGKNEHARFVLGLLRDLEDDFWKRRIERPSAERLAVYEKRAGKLRQQDLEGRIDIVRFAEQRGLEELAMEELRALLLELEEPLVFDDKGRLLLAGEKLSRSLAERVRAEAIEIDGLLYARDACLARLPQLTHLHETAAPSLRVLSSGDEAEAARLHAAASQLLPLLYADLGVVPERRPRVLVLHVRSLYTAYLDIVGLSAHRGTDGFADRLTNTAVVCRENPAHETLTEENLLGLTLHELTHLCQLSASPAAFPPWYLEGSAEKHGGEGAFHWDGETLTTGGLMARVRLDELRARPFTLQELFDADPLALLAADRLAARRFYTGAWAFLRFLEQGCEPRIADRLDQWRRICLGSILGADLYRAYAMDASASQRLFLDLFGDVLPRLESDFQTWLAGL